MRNINKKVSFLNSNNTGKSDYSYNSHSNNRKPANIKNLVNSDSEDSSNELSIIRQQKKPININTNPFNPLNKSKVFQTENRIFPTTSEKRPNNKLVFPISNNFSKDSEEKFSSDKNTSNRKENWTTIRRKSRLNSTALKGSNYIEQEWVVSVIENYAREVGISAFNLRTMEVYVSQYIDNEAYVNSLAMINYWRPLELVMNVKSEDSCLHLLIKKHFRNCYVGLLPRKSFAEDAGKEIYLQSGCRELTTEEVSTKYVCMASLSGLVNYLETQSQIRIEKENLNIKFYYLENHLNISFQTTIDLELLFNKKFRTKESSLFSLFRCQTVCGHRLLRSNLLQPLARRDDLNKRYEAVQELIENPELIGYIRQTLPYFKDLEIHIAKFLHKLEEPSESVIKGILTAIQGLRISLKSLTSFREIIKHKLKSELFVTISKSFEDGVFETLLESIDTLIEDFDFTKTKITRKADSIYFLIKAGINNVLDVSRKTYSDTINEIHAIFARLKETTNDPMLKLLYSESAGYYVALSEKYYVEADWVVTKKVGKKFHCASIPLLSLSERIKEIKRDLIDISMSLVTNIVKLICKNLSYLYVVSSYIALLDVLCAFAEFSKYFSTVVPIVNIDRKNPFIFGKNCSNPVMADGRHDTPFVANDHFLCSHFNILLLKGANASGKTTYMKTLALNTILAQIGCFVPCDYFEFSPRKFLYTKFDSNDSVEESKGTFVKEIIEIQKVLSNQLTDALILLDEPFDNSDSLDNLSLSIALLDSFSSESQIERINNNSNSICSSSGNANRSFVVISSHNNSLTSAASNYFNIVLGSMVVEASDDSLRFLFKFRFTNPLYKDNYVADYGIILAQMIGFDREVVDKAKEISLKTKQGGQNDYFEASDKVSVLKVFWFKFLLSVYELKYISKCYILEEEVTIKKREIAALLKGCLGI